MKFTDVRKPSWMVADFEAEDDEWTLTVRESESGSRVATIHGDWEDLVSMVFEQIEARYAAGIQLPNGRDRRKRRLFYMDQFVLGVQTLGRAADAAGDGQVQPQKVCDCSPTYVAGDGPLQPCKGDCTKTFTDPKGGGQ